MNIMFQFMLHFILLYMMSDARKVYVRFRRVLHFYYLKRAKYI